MNRLVGDSGGVGELGLDDRDENDLGEHGDEMDGGDGLDETSSSSRDGVGLDMVSSRDGESEETSLLSCSFLLLILSPSPNMHFFSRLTSDNFTGFTMKSSAPSSKHLNHHQTSTNQIKNQMI